MLDYLPAQLPPRAVVESVSPAAANAIAAFNELDRSLPARRSGDQLNQLDELRAAAFTELGDDVFQNLAREKSELLAALTEDVSRIRDHWCRLEEVNGLNQWRDHQGQHGYTTRPIACLNVTLGMGMVKSITGRELISAIGATVAKIGG